MQCAMLLLHILTMSLLGGYLWQDSIPTVHGANCRDSGQRQDFPLLSRCISPYNAYRDTAKQHMQFNTKGRRQT